MKKPFYCCYLFNVLIEEPTNTEKMGGSFQESRINPSKYVLHLTTEN
jgi:hypothetical protein